MSKLTNIILRKLNGSDIVICKGREFVKWQLINKPNNEKCSWHRLGWIMTKARTLIIRVDNKISLWDDAVDVIMNQIILCCAG